MLQLSSLTAVEYFLFFLKCEEFIFHPICFRGILQLLANPPILGQASVCGDV